MLLKKSSVKEYTDNNELKEFCEQIWGDYMRELDESIITNLLSIQSHGLNNGTWFDDRIIKVYKAEIQKFPPIPFDIIAYRGGDMNTRGRSFLSASFYKKTAERFAQKKKQTPHDCFTKRFLHCSVSVYMVSSEFFGARSCY